MWIAYGGELELPLPWISHCTGIPIGLPWTGFTAGKTAELTKGIGRRAVS